MDARVVLEKSSGVSGNRILKTFENITVYRKDKQGIPVTKLGCGSRNIDRNH